jgi:LysM repeat protein
MENYEVQYEMKNMPNSETDEVIPSRKQRHPKPKSFLEKPVFSLILFILFILILGGIFIYYYNVNQTEPTNPSMPESDMEDAVEGTDEEIAVNDTDDAADQSGADEVNTNEEMEPPSPPESQTAVSDPLPEANETNEQEEKESITYTVKPGETLFSIAKKYYDPVREGIKKIQEANGLKDSNIKANMILIIPEPNKNP